MKAIRNPVTTRFLRLRSRNCALATDEPTRKQMPRIINHVRLMGFQRIHLLMSVRANRSAVGCQPLVRSTIHSLIRAVLVRLLIGQRLLTRDSPHLSPLSSARREGRVRGGGNRKSPPYLVGNGLEPLDLARRLSTKSAWLTERFS